MADGLVNCPSCGARVDAAPGEQAYVATCRFCGARIPIAPLVKPPDPRAEALKAAIALRAQQAQREAAGEAAAVAVKTAGKSIGCIVLVSTLLPILIPVGIFVVPWAMKTYAGHYGAFPITVDTNDTVEIADRTETGTDTMITVGLNGKLTIRRCHLKGPQIVKAGTNAEITIVDSALDGAKGIVAGDSNVTLTIENSTITSGEEILDVPINAKVSVTKGSKITSAAVAFPLETNGEVTIDHSEVDGKLGAIELKNNGKVKLTDSAVVKSDGTAIDLALNGHLTITSSRVESKTMAVHAGSNLEGTLHAATVIGAKKLGSNSSLEDR